MNKRGRRYYGWEIYVLIIERESIWRRWGNYLKGMWGLVGEVRSNLSRLNVIERVVMEWYFDWDGEEYGKVDWIRGK